MQTGFYWDERCFWFGGGNYAFTLPVGGLVQPLAAGGLPESPETKRRLKNLMDVTGLTHALRNRSAEPANIDDIARVHPVSYIKDFQRLSNETGGELGLRTPFGAGGFDQAALSAGLTRSAILDVMSDAVSNAYALSRPPGHHCLPNFPNGFCLLANIAIGVQAARQNDPDLRVAIVDWDVHHGNGTEAIFLDDPNTLTVSIHQARNYPIDTGDADVRGANNSNINVPLSPGGGHQTYMNAMEWIVLPALHAFKPDLIVVACGYDAAAIDPLGRMLASADTFRQMTQRIKSAAAELCQDRLVLVHEGGYSEVYVPFCGHATIAELAGSDIDAPDPLAATVAARQPQENFQQFLDSELNMLRQEFDL